MHIRRILCNIKSSLIHKHIHTPRAISNHFSSRSCFFFHSRCYSTHQVNENSRRHQRQMRACGRLTATTDAADEPRRVDARTKRYFIWRHAAEHEKLLSQHVRSFLRVRSVSFSFVRPCVTCCSFSICFPTRSNVIILNYWITIQREHMRCIHTQAHTLHNEKELRRVYLRYLPYKLRGARKPPFSS